MASFVGACLQVGVSYANNIELSREVFKEHAPRMQMLNAIMITALPVYILYKTRLPEDPNMWTRRQVIEASLTLGVGLCGMTLIVQEFAKISCGEWSLECQDPEDIGGCEFYQRYQCRTILSGEAAIGADEVADFDKIGCLRSSSAKDCVVRFFKHLSGDLD
jgi:hypothetical protein